MTLKLIKTEKDYQTALARLDEIFDAKVGSIESDEADILALLIDEYENKHYPIEAPDPIEAIKIRMKELDIKQKDLVGIIGGKSRVSEILNKRKKLTVDMVRSLAERLNLSVQILVRDYQLLK